MASREWWYWRFGFTTWHLVTNHSHTLCGRRFRDPYVAVAPECVPEALRCGVCISLAKRESS